MSIDVLTVLAKEITVHLRQLGFVKLVYNGFWVV